MKAKGVAILFSMLVAGSPMVTLANGEPVSDASAESLFKLLIIPFGLGTFASLVTTITLGRKIARNRAAVFPWHRRLAFCTMALAICHAVLVIFFH